MKKKLEADLMSIAHRVLQMKNKSDINQMYNETQKLYEKLSILRFVEEHFEGPKPTIGQAEIVEKMKHFFEEIHVADPLIQSVKPETIIEEVVVEEQIEEEMITSETVVETVVEEIIVEETVEAEVPIEVPEEEESEIIAEELIESEESKDFGFLPAFELDEVEDKDEEVEGAKEEVVVDVVEPNKPDEVQISFMDLLGGDYSEPMFVKVDQAEKAPSKIAFDLPKETNFQLDKETVEAPKETVKVKSSEPKSVSLNDKFAKGITIGLNDRIAFVKHLFGNSDEDYSRVMSQLITYDNFEEVQSFIEDMVKPDYNNWEGKDDYSQRFMEIIEKKFV